MRIATWNVNSVRQRLELLLAWLKECQPDVVCLQEIKCTDDAFPRLEIEELGYNVEYYLWVGFFAPKGTPDNVITTLRNAIKQGAHSPAFANALTNLGQELAYLDQPDFKAFWDADAKRIEEAVRTIGKVEG